MHQDSLRLAFYRNTDNLFSQMSPAVLSSNQFAALLATSSRLAEQAHTFGALRPTRVLSLGLRPLDDVLPQQGLPLGSVVELQVRGASGAATSFALSVCRAALSLGEQAAGALLPHRGQAQREQRWCAFIDPSATLFAPGVAQLGVNLQRLLIVRPDIKAIERIAVRIAEAKIVSVLVIDLRGALGDQALDERRWQRTVRRLSLAVKSLSTCVVLITQANVRASLPLPVALRLEFDRGSSDTFQIRVAKERTGRISPARDVPWSVFRAA
jgi:hypothetical protein